MMVGGGVLVGCERFSQGPFEVRGKQKVAVFHPDRIVPGVVAVYERHRGGDPFELLLGGAHHLADLGALPVFGEVERGGAGGVVLDHMLEGGF